MGPSSSAISVPALAAASAALAAWIAGLFSLLGLLTSKEQKVSEFRQAWIDALRLEIALLIAHAHQIYAYVAMHKPIDSKQFWKETRDDYLALNGASTRIKLRVNHDEQESKLILCSMEKMESLFGDLPTAVGNISLEKINKIVDELERDAPLLLKKEWNRVKRGELVYRIAKWLAAGLLIITGIAAGWLFYKLL
ncbi:MAG: hypothetical protein ACYCPO_15590 [Acidobacteriaceae bacterium]